jgi:hypothetical protein
VVGALNEAEKIPRTEYTRADLLSLMPRTQNIDQTAGHPKQKIGGCSLEKDKGAPPIADNRGLFQDLIYDALGNPARGQLILDLLIPLSSYRTRSAHSGFMLQLKYLLAITGGVMPHAQRH